MASGRGVRIAIVDSGVHADHPHVGGVAGGVAIDAHGDTHEGYVDHLGHGTAITAAIREKAPDAELFAVKVFDRELSTSIASLVAGIDWAVASGMHLVNLSLGTSRQEHATVLGEAVARATAQGAIVVAARADGGIRWLPGSLPGVLAVEVDWTLPRDRFRAETIDGATVFRASGFAREIPGVAPERNLHGVSFAVANVTGFAAQALEAPSHRSFEALIERLLLLQRLVEERARLRG